MDLLQTTSQLFQLSFTAIVAALLGGLTAQRLPNRQSKTLRIEIPLLILLGLSLALLVGDSILQVFWQVEGLAAIFNEVILLIRSVLSFLLIVSFFMLTLNIADKIGWLRLITAFVLVALSTSFIEAHYKLPAVTHLHAFWLLSFAVSVTILLVSYIVVRIHKRATRRTRQAPQQVGDEGLHQTPDPAEA